ncbi:hypothetical protein GCM10023403_26320 [Pseudonocardia benzenivorans]
MEAQPAVLVAGDVVDGGGLGPQHLGVLDPVSIRPLGLPTRRTTVDTAEQARPDQ